MLTNEFNSADNLGNPDLPTQSVLPPMARWQIAGASSIGKAHIEVGLPNQDAMLISQDSELGIVVCAVSDGAGSAKFSEIGSQYFSQAVAQMLLNSARQAVTQNNGNTDTQAAINGLQAHFTPPTVIEKINHIRQHLAEQQGVAISQLNDYHATLVAVVIFEKFDTALHFQIGDSPLLTSRFQPIQNANSPDTLDYFADFSLSDNPSTEAEYVNETQFITQDNWADFMQLRWLDTKNTDLLALMTDGCADLVLAGGTMPRQIYRPFFANLVFNLLSLSHNSQTTDMTAQANEFIQTTLANPATYRLTGDDKTLIVLLKNTAHADYHTLEPYLATEQVVQNLNLQNPTSSTVWTTQATKLPTENSAVTPPSLSNSLSENTLYAESNQYLKHKTPLTAANPSLAPATRVIPETLPTPIQPPARDKHTKNMLLAGGAILLGIMALAGLNKDWLGEHFATKRVQATPISAPAATPTIAMQSPNDATIKTAITTPLRVHNLYDRSLLQVVVGFTQGEMQLPNAAPVKVGEIYPTILENSPSTTTASSTTRSPKASVAIPLYATASCQPLVTQDSTKQHATFSQYQILPNPAWEYAQCQVILQGYQEQAGKLQKVTLQKVPLQKVPLPKGVNEVLLPQGLSPIFTHSNASKASPLASATQVTQVALPIQIYYLPISQHL